MTNLKNLNIKNLSDSDIQCSDNTIVLGGTLTAKWGYVFKVTDVSSASKEAYITLLKEGNEIETRLMKIGDIFLISNPLDSEEKQSIKLTNVFQGQEASACFFRYCSWTQQYSNLLMIADIPSTVTDGQSYTISGKLTKDKVNESLETVIINEKIYITESGSKIIEAITNSDGIFEITFTYHYGFSYSILYEGTIDVNGIEHLLTTHTNPGSTHLLKYTFPTPIPEVITTMFRYISPSNLISKMTQLIDERYPTFGWTIDEIVMSETQLLIYATQTNSQPSTYSIYNISTRTIQTLILDEAGFLLVTIAIFGLALCLLGAVGITGGAFAAAAFAIGFLLIARREIWKLISGLPGQLLADLGKSEPTTGEVNNDTKEFINEKLKECTDVYNSTSKTTEDCIRYGECMRDTYANFQEFTQAYLFGKVSSSLTANAKKLKSDIDIKCINKFKNSEISCEDLIVCTTTEGNNSILSGDSIIYNTYPESDTYIPPWEEENGNGGNIINTLLLAGGLVTIGYIGYKTLTSKNKDSNK